MENFKFNDSQECAKHLVESIQDGKFSPDFFNAKVPFSIDEIVRDIFELNLQRALLDQDSDLEKTDGIFLFEEGAKFRFFTRERSFRFDEAIFDSLEEAVKVKILFWANGHAIKFSK